MEAIRTHEIITEKGLIVNLPEFKKYINQRVEVIIFPLPNEDKKTKKPMKDFRGVLKGKVWMSDDFNAPIDVLKDYMK